LRRQRRRRSRKLFTHLLENLSFFTFGQSFHGASSATSRAAVLIFSYVYAALAFTSAMPSLRVVNIKRAITSSSNAT
jgi:hypothetical protein